MPYAGVNPILEQFFSYMTQYMNSQVQALLHCPQKRGHQQSAVLASERKNVRSDNYPLRVRAVASTAQLT